MTETIKAVEHSRPQRRSTPADVLIGIRDGVLHRLLGIKAEEILNSAPLEGQAQPATLVMTELKRAANALKAAAIDESGRHVAYDRLRATEAYREYRASYAPRLRQVDPGTLAGREARLAFWINLYNVLVIDAVIAFGVRHSVAEGRLDMLRFFRRAAYDVGGQRMSLEDIEHGILRANRGSLYLPGPQFGASDPRRRWVIAPMDPRIHLALNCASRSCPPIGVYDADHIDAQLDLAARNFIAHEVQVDPASGTVSLSSIFRWYAGDFGGQAGVIDFLVRHMPEGPGRDWLEANRARARLVYTPYDWSLNT